MLCLDDDAKKAAFVAAQFKEAKYQDGKSVQEVTCGCGVTMPLRFAYRCLYCGEFYCQTCAEAHFGKTREQYNAERDERHNVKVTGAPPNGGQQESKR
jgi:hypothetical protein